MITEQYLRESLQIFKYHSLCCQKEGLMESQMCMCADAPTEYFPPTLVIFLNQLPRP